MATNAESGATTHLPDTTSSSWSRTLTTRSGFCFYVRPATPADEPALGELFRHVSREDMRFRFLSAVREVGRDRLVEMTAVDHDRTEDFLAFDDDGRTLVASAMLALDTTRERAEVAIAVREDFKGRGIGWTLLEHVARYAEARGVKVLESVESRENHAAIELEREVGFTVEACPGDATLVIVRREIA